MTDEKITTLDELDKKMAEQKARMKEKVQKEQQPPPEQLRHTPWTDKMSDVFKENIEKSQKCSTCNWQNFGQSIVLLNTIFVMKEKLPLPTFICSQCGTLFVPKWARTVANQAIDQENKIMKQMTSPHEMAPSGAD